MLDLNVHVLFYVFSLVFECKNHSTKKFLAWKLSQDNGLNWKQKPSKLPIFNALKTNLKIRVRPIEESIL